MSRFRSASIRSAHLYARAGEDLGIGTIWCGSGSNTPSLTQLELIRELKPTIWAGMGSYGLHLANLAEAQRHRSRRSSVQQDHRRRRAAVARQARRSSNASWGAEVSDQFGMTEGALISVQAPGEDGLRMWSDLFLCEVVDETTGEPVPDGEVGTLVDHAAVQQQRHAVPALEFGRPHQHEPAERRRQAWSMFPVMRHARRTVGFFKVRGVNINHNELEDLMFYNASVTDFKAEVVSIRWRPRRAAAARSSRSAALDAERLAAQHLRRRRADLRGDAGDRVPRARHARQGIRSEHQGRALRRQARADGWPWRSSGTCRSAPSMSAACCARRN